ncbi:MAG: DsbA family protein [Deltaproteobacteria bacterium]|nr:DsbA family protein [Deltaproteobacteria bacterium]MBW2384667.1 DsbA family protein [Deltaproteobacteria bacterium]MBW2696418.1 DsbA family protein [Deltaproteobacteria bacterium]
MGPLQVAIHYDFASTLCYVAHRIVERMQGFLEEIEVEPFWTPIDLAPIMRWTRGMQVTPDRRLHIQQIAAALEVEAKVPTIWLDSRPVAATALALESDPARAASWRERVLSCVYEEGERCDDPDQIARMQRELGIEVDAAAHERALAELERRTRGAVEEMVTGVPTFMLGRWPFGGIQEEDTMRSLLGRWAGRQRERQG